MREPAPVIVRSTPAAVAAVAMLAYWRTRVRALRGELAHAEEQIIRWMDALDVDLAPWDAECDAWRALARVSTISDLGDRRRREEEAHARLRKLGIDPLTGEPLRPTIEGVLVYTRAAATASGRSVATRRGVAKGRGSERGAE
jgi:hypothetical protein